MVRALSPTHTRNHGRRYSYYASNMNDDAGAPALRLPAGEIEQATRRAIARWFRKDTNLQRLTASMPAAEKTEIFDRAGTVASTIELASISETRKALNAMQLSVAVNENGIRGTFEPRDVLGDAAEQEQATKSASFEVSLERQSYGLEPRLRLKPSEPDKPARDQHLVELLGRAFGARATLLAMSEAKTKSIKTTRLRHLQRLARLSYLDPTIVRQILAGTQRADLSSRSLWRMADLPTRWKEQREALCPTTT